MSHSTSFAKAAKTYEENANIQAQIWQALFEQFPIPRTTESILDVGCGPGHLTATLKTQYGNAKILGIDAAMAMIETAKAQHQHIAFKTASIETFQGERFDTLVSNATLHWCQDANHIAKQIDTLLTSSGTGHFSIYLPDSFSELNRIIQTVLGPTPLPVQQFMSLDTWISALNSYFKTEWVHYHVIQPFDSVKDILKHIKLTGTKGDTPALFWTPHHITKCESLFKTQFGRPLLSHHVALIRIQK